MKIVSILLFLSLLAGQVLALTVCDVQQYSPSTGFSPYEGMTVTVTGVITVPAGIFVSSQTSMYLRGLGSDVCGINIFAFGQGVGNLGLGDTVTVTGQVQEYVSGSGATTELVFGDESGLSNIRRADTAYVEPVAMRTGDAGREDNEGKLVRLTGKVVGKEPPDGLTLDDGSGRIEIYDFGGVFQGDSTWQSLNWGDEVTITGIVTQYDPSLPYLSDYQIWPRGAGAPFYDLFVPRCVPDTVTSKAVLEILDADDNEVAIFCPECPGADGQVRIRYNGPHGSRVQLRVFDGCGREVATLYDYYVLCGAKVFEWDGRNELNERLPMGLYHVVVTATGPDAGKDSQTMAPIVIGRRLK
jgi:hypothetical protein